MKAYAGIGSRETPMSVRCKMAEVATLLARAGWTLRSGGAKGADRAFEGGTIRGEGGREIYYPRSPMPQAWYDFAERYHPNWEACSGYVQSLHARNSPIIMGEHLDDPVQFVLCWTADGRASGGTGQGLRIARAFQIKTFNIYSDPDLQEFFNWVRKRGK